MKMNIAYVTKVVRVLGIKQKFPSNCFSPHNVQNMKSIRKIQELVTMTSCVVKT